MEQSNPTGTPVLDRNGDAPRRLTKEQLADRTRFRFREQELEIPEIGGTITLKSLSVREREMLPDPAALAEIDDEGKRTEESLRNAGQVFACIVADPKVTPEEAAAFLADWPAEAFDRVTAAYGELIGTEEETKAASAEFPNRD
jgi:hypothetical protein